MRTLSAELDGTFTDLVLIEGGTSAVRLDTVTSTPGRTDALNSGVGSVTATSECLAPDLAAAAVCSGHRHSREPGAGIPVDSPPFRREFCGTAAGLAASGLGDDHVP
ncbi:MAG: hypothetical protein J4G15_03145 [Alphaproteobacteria bacterium]|nr:hypothetical protein [Alphaproteobacteria bacterium]